MKKILLALFGSSLLFAGGEFPSSYQDLTSEFGTQISKSEQKNAPKKEKKELAKKADKQKAKDALQEEVPAITYTTSFSKVAAYKKEHKLLKVERYNSRILEKYLKQRAAKLNAASVLVYQHSNGEYFYFYFQN